MGIYKNPSVINNGRSCVLPAHFNYGKCVLEKFSKNKDKIALIDGATGEKLTFGEMVQQIISTAVSLRQIGVNIEATLGICSENRTEFLITAIAAICAGNVVTFINSAYSKDELIHTMNISKPRVMFMSPNTFKNYFETIKNIDFVEKVVIFGTEAVSENNCVIHFKSLAANKVDYNLYETEDIKSPDQTALILYSSGTTGLPKGAKLSHRNLIISGLEPLMLPPNQVFLTLAPWSNTVGIICTMRGLLFNETFVYLNRFVEDTYFKCIEKYKVGVLLAVPPLVVLLSQSKVAKNYDVSTVELIYCGGATLDKGRIIDSKNTFPNLKTVLQGYGATEASGAITEERDDSPRPGSVGTTVLGISIKVVDIDTRQLLGPHEPGEVCIKGPVIFQGYIGKDLKDDLDEEGFYKTGDVAYYDEDGYFYIVDRIKELIKYKAGQVAPSELEAILRGHPAVLDVGVTGAPDPLVGELPTAFVVKTPKSNVTEKDLVDFVAPKVSSWKQLRGGVRFVQEIPKTPSGKILRRKLRQLLNKPASKL